jgi:hypothetical protein
MHKGTVLIPYAYFIMNDVSPIGKGIQILGLTDI